MARAKAADLSTLDVIRMNLSQFEQAVAREDADTAHRCVDAAELMFRGLRAETSGARGCEVGPPVWRGGERPEAAAVTAPEPAPMALPPASPAAGDIEEAVRRALRAERVIIPPPMPVAPWLARLERREWAWGILARLTWCLICCVAALGWRGVRRGFGGAR